MSKMIDKVVKLTITAGSLEEAEEIAKKEQGVKKIFESKLTTQIFEVVTLQEWYGKHNLGYCQYCGDSLSHRAEVFSESCGCDE